MNIKITLILFIGVCLGLPKVLPAQTTELVQEIIQIAQTASPEDLRSLNRTEANNLIKNFRLSITALVDQGHYDLAITIARQVVALCEIRSHEAPADFCISVNTLAQLYIAIDENENVEPLFLQTRKIPLEAFADPSEYAKNLNNFAAFYIHTSEYEKAVPLFLQAEEILIRAKLTDHPAYRYILVNQGTLYAKMGAYRKAEKLILDALKSMKNAQEEHSLLYGQTVNGLASVYSLMGEYENAEPLYLQSLKIKEDVRDTNQASYATGLNNLAEFYRKIGVYKKAEPLYLQALEIKHRSSAELGSTIQNLGLLYSSMGRVDEAVSLFLVALEIKGKISVTNSNYAQSLSNLAGLYGNIGKNDLAEEFYLKAIKITKELKSDRMVYAEILNNLAFLYQKRGAFDQAEPLFLESKEIREKAVGMVHPDYAQSLENLAYLYKAQQKPDAANLLVHELLGIQRVLLGRILGAFPEKDREQYIQSLDLLNLPASLENGPLVAESLVAFKGAIGASLLEDKRLLQASNNPQAAAQIAHMQDLRSQFQQATLQEQKQRAEDLFAQIETVEKELSRFVTGLGQTRRALLITTGEVQTVLPANTALVELVRYQRPIYDDKKRQSWQWRYGAAVLRHQGEPAFVNLALANELDEAVQNFRTQAEGRASNGAAEKAARHLYDLVLKPLEAALGDAFTVLFSPDSQLHFISFDALPDAKGRMACEKWNIRYTETGRDLLDQSNPTTGSRNQTALLLGDPLYGQIPSDQPATSQPLDPSTSALLESLNRDAAMPTGFIAKNRSGNGSGAGWESLTFSALPGTGAELLKLGTLLESKGWKVKKLLQSEATESKLRGLTHGPAILHLATHGFFVNALDDDSLDANLPGGSSEFLANSATKPSRPPSDPMLRSGMALTGAQHTLGQWNTGQVPDPGNDGMLLAAEVVNYNLSGTELVVLSACETAKGKTLDGEGIYGLRRALKMAGADSVVMTLWPVNDAYTVDFMEDFYTRYLGGMHPCRALAETKKEHLRKLTRDPARGFAAAVRLVAPFIATGKGVEAVEAVK